MMLVHIGQTDVAERVHNAWLRTIEDGIHTYDIYDEGVSKQKVGTKEFAQAVVARVGQKPREVEARHVQVSAPRQIGRQRKRQSAPVRKKELVGVDVFVDWTRQAAPDELGATHGEGRTATALKLVMIDSRGTKV